jgi:hypothetical protein
MVSATGKATPLACGLDALTERTVTLAAASLSPQTDAASSAMNAHRKRTERARNLALETI